MRNLKIIIPVLIIICIIGAGIIYGPKLLVKRDLDKICSISNTYQSQLESAEDPVATVVAYSEAIHAAVFHPGVKNFLQALAVSENNSRQEIIRQAAKELGYPDWNCPAFEKIHIH